MKKCTGCGRPIDTVVIRQCPKCINNRAGL